MLLRGLHPDASRRIQPLPGSLCRLSDTGFASAGDPSREDDCVKRRSPGSAQSQVALISALVVVVVGVSLLAVLVVGVLEGIRGMGPLVLGGLTIGVFLLAFRLLMVARNLRAKATTPSVRPPRQATPRRRPQPRPVTRRP